MGVLFMMPQWEAVSEAWMHRMMLGLSPFINVIATEDTRGNQYWRDSIRAISLNAPPQKIRYISRLYRNFGLLLRRNQPQGSQKLLKALTQYPITQIFCQYGTYATKYLDVLLEANLPLFIHFHGYDAEFDLRSINQPQEFIHENDYLTYLKRLESIATFITNSNSAKQKLVSAGLSSENIYIKYYGIPLPEFSRVHKKSEKNKILHLGRLIDCKSPDRTIKAFEIARSKGLEAELVIAGDGPLKPMCELLRIRSPYKESISLLGSVQQSEVQSLLQQSDIFTQHNIAGEITHQTESLGASILEAMSYGLPVIGTRNGGVLETVVDGETGILNEPGDVEAQANAFLELARNPELRQKMGNAGRKRVAEHFSPDQEKDQLLKIMGLS